MEPQSEKQAKKGSKTPPPVTPRKAARVNIDEMAAAARKANREGKTRKFPE